MSCKVQHRMQTKLPIIALIWRAKKKKKKETEEKSSNILEVPSDFIFVNMINHYYNFLIQNINTTTDQQRPNNTRQNEVKSLFLLLSIQL